MSDGWKVVNNAIKFPHSIIFRRVNTRKVSRADSVEHNFVSKKVLSSTQDYSLAVIQSLLSTLISNYVTADQKISLFIRNIRERVNFSFCNVSGLAISS